MPELVWAGSNTLTWGDGRSASVSSWGDPVPVHVVDPPIALSDLPTTHSPRRLWKTQPSLRKVVDFAASAISAVPLHVYVRESDTERRRDAGGDAETALRHPSIGVTGARLVHDLVTDWMLYDRWLVVVIDGALRRVPAGLIDVKADFLGGLTALRIRTGEGLVDVTDGVWAYDAGWGGDEEGGVSPLHTLGAILEEQARAVRYRSELWRNAPRTSGVLYSETVLARQNRARLKEQWKAYSEGQAGGTPLLEGGVKFEPTQAVKPSDMNDLAGRQLADVEVASAYHIAPELVGARPGTFANIAAFKEMLYGPALGPYMTRIESALNARLIPHLAPAGAYAEFAREAALAGSFREQAEVLSKSTGAPWLTRAEARARMNLPHLEETDELIVPLNVIEGGLASPADTAPSGDPEWGAP